MIICQSQMLKGFNRVPGDVIVQTLFVSGQPVYPALFLFEQGLLGVIISDLLYYGPSHVIGCVIVSYEMF